MARPKSKSSKSGIRKTYESFSGTFRRSFSEFDTAIRNLSFFRQETLATFDDVHQAEIKCIDVRRKSRKVKPFTKFGRPPLSNGHGNDRVLDTVGLALSGGGVRSAAFSLGALQALQVADAIKRIDYLSTVSGGGYIGASLSAGMSLNDGRIPFPSEMRKDESPTLQHIRDYSNYLIPHGFPDAIRDVVIYFRGLAANFLFILPWLLAAAALTLYFSPTRDRLLEPTIVKSIWIWFFGSFPTLLEAAPFLFSVLVAVGFVAALVVWAIWRSLRSKTHAPEIPGFIPDLFMVLFVTVLAVFLLSLQPYVLDAMFTAAEHRADRHANDGTAPALLIDWVRYLIIGLAPVAAIIGAIGNKLLWLIWRTTELSNFATKAKSVSSKLAIYLAALIVPLLLRVAYLQLCFWVIADRSGGYEAPQWLQWPAEHFYSLVVTAFAWLGYDVPILQPVGGAPKYQVMLTFYAWLALLLAITSLTLNQNANSLHRLYRDRLSKAFLVRPKYKLARRDEEIETIDTFKLSDLQDGKAPYHLINAAFNLQASKNANRRGRNADFFLFSKKFIGSETTGYVSTSLMEARAKRVDLATAMAISGAAAASNMGTSSIRSWTASLALLNVRLGYWLRNPKLLVHALVRPDEIPIPYFLREMFGLLNENRKYVYVTDGGHVENLGVYELLRRRCCLIIVVDGEADPGMHFNSLVRLERYARIDLGIRIDLPWQEIRTATLLVGHEIEKRGDPGNLISKTGPHCAIGKIYYPGGQGRLLYIKSSMTGDKSSYVTDYKRRHASFPHETTGDQFFTEEQFEVYRALGFHAVQGVFSGRDRIAIMRKPGKLKQMRLRAGETAALNEIKSVLQTMTSKVLPTYVPREPLPELKDAGASN